MGKGKEIATVCGNESQDTLGLNPKADNVPASTGLFMLFIAINMILFVSTYPQSGAECIQESACRTMAVKHRQ